MIKFGYTILYVENVENTVTFYKEAFGFAEKFITPDKDYAELLTGDTTLSFASYSIADYTEISILKNNSKDNPPAFELTFVTDNIEEAFTLAINNGAVLVKEPAAKPWGQIIGYVKDINGFLIEICTPAAQ